MSIGKDKNNKLIEIIILLFAVFITLLAIFAGDKSDFTDIFLFRLFIIICWIFGIIVYLVTRKYKIKK